MADISTLVSVMPRPLREYKPGVYPGWYEMPAVPRGEVAVLHVEMAMCYVTLEEDRGTISKPIPSAEICRSVVQDFCSANVDIDEGSGPGLFYVEGKFTKEDIMEEFSEKLAEVVARQINWFSNLLKSADNDWNKFRKHNVITEWERAAAIYLNITNREWQIEIPVDAPVVCVACGTINKAGIIICPNCHVVLDKVKAEELGLTFAGTP